MDSLLCVQGNPAAAPVGLVHTAEVFRTSDDNERDWGGVGGGGEQTGADAEFNSELLHYHQLDSLSASAVAME